MANPTATVTMFALQSGTDRKMIFKWSWDKANTDHYKVRWWWAAEDMVPILGTETTTTLKQSTWDAPANAAKVWAHVMPISQTKKAANGKETVYWTADWTNNQIPGVMPYYFKNNPPGVPPTPTVKMEGAKLTATLENLDVNATNIHFEVVRDNSDTPYTTARVAIVNGHATHTWVVAEGYEYKVRCYAYRGDDKSDWSPFSGNSGTAPSAPSGITVCRAASETSVYLEWSSVRTAKKYDIEYTTERNYFDSSNSTTTVTSETTSYTLTGLGSGKTYFFRVRAINDSGNSGWSGVASVIVGEKPAAPTTWSSTTTAVIGEAITLFWMHNAKDGSSETNGKLEISINGVVQTNVIANTADKDKKDQVKSYQIDTSSYVEGAKILWRVQTAGITGEYGDWSVQRTIDVYAQPTLAMTVVNHEGDYLNVLTSFPIHITASADPKTQTPIGYHMIVVANESYETTDGIGNSKWVSKGETVWSKYFDISEDLTVDISASDVDFANNISYTIECVVSMNSGLTAKASKDFSVSWTATDYTPNAEIGVDAESFMTIIKPYCKDENDNLVPDVWLSVYRREFDGSFTELIKNINNEDETFITDPHPALDYARYRIVATSKITGLVDYYDMPGYPVGGTCVVIQWDEKWINFDTMDGPGLLAEPNWTGSMLKLPYNIDVSNDHKPDVELVEYIGRAHPVSYYGTQVGETATWNVVIQKDDTDTLYALRRLAKWMGDAYVREPSGSGYWANVEVSFSQKYDDITIPVTFTVTRVEGGV